MNTHNGLPVAGYQAQTNRAVELVNENKILEERVLRQLDSLPEKDPNLDPRWASIARTHIEQGFMAANRAIFRPQRVGLTENQD